MVIMDFGNTVCNLFQLIMNIFTDQDESKNCLVFTSRLDLNTKILRSIISTFLAHPKTYQNINSPGKNALFDSFAFFTCAMLLKQGNNQIQFPYSFFEL